MASKRLWPHEDKRYGDLSENEQRAIWQSWYESLKEKNKHACGGYVVNDNIDEPGRPPIYDQSFLVYFLAPDQRTVWAINILTAAEAMFEASFMRASTEADRRSPKETFETFLKKTQKIGGEDKLLFLLPEGEPDPALDGMSRMDFTKREARRIAVEDQPRVYEQVVVTKNQPGSLSFAIIVIDRPFLNAAAVNDAIGRLHLNGYSSEIESAPVPSENLPKGDRSIMFLLFRKDNPDYNYGPWGLDDDDVRDITRYIDMSYEEYCNLVSDRRKYQVAMSEEFLEQLSGLAEEELI